ncbi:hypothetical protein H7J07_02320 [Mycobacterium koreense]|uniref:Uncharacterized protein n=1 Tax=Mycolicibacillus koreensis TaxID=1069220 RepID=A0AA91PCI7_9MYCO|nr:hypothetical protein [Mycolicibacillus koreensis]MCV7247095.1 hypothetical protein [Mycolicibacillus koreensis]ODR09935.1 hypothetical protein BHQ15_06310 [Mycolicibacillus koreensis]OSC31882.1 hypothetical protein B8W67_15460 [Mycolicibacillus koreensis]
MSAPSPSGRRARLQALLARPVRVDAVLEALVWLVVPYMLIGLVVTFSQPESLDRVHTLLAERSPQNSGFDLVEFGLATALWPALLVHPGSCAR